jgi:hypothetical protein
VRAILVDASASVTRLRPGWEGWVRASLEAELEQAEELGEDALVVLYAKDVLAIAGPERAQSAAGELAREDLLLDGEGASASELAAALEMAESKLGDRSLARLRLYSDRSFTGVDPAARLARIEARGAAREWIELPPMQLGDLALTRLDLPEEAEPDAPLATRAWLAYRGPPASGPIAYELEVELAGPSGTATQVLLGELAAVSGQPVPVSIALGPAQRGTSRVSVRARLADQPGSGDAIPENDRAAGSVEVGDDLRLAVVLDASAPAGCSAWVDALAALPGFAVQRIGSEQVAQVLEATDVLVTIDVDPRALPCEVLATHLEGGGGWLALAGLQSLAGLESAACIAQLLPLDFAASAGPGRDIAILLDGSGSMAGAPVDEARRAARALASAVPADDRVVLRWFTDELEREIEVDRGGAAHLEAREAGGATDIPRSLAQLAAERASKHERPTLALLVSDGRDQQGSDADLAALRGLLRSSGVELSIVAIGQQADLGFLGRLAGPEGRVATAQDPSALERLLLRESAAHRLRSAGRYEVSFGPDAAGPLAIDVASPQALQRDALPSIEAYVRGEPRAGASAPWIAAEGEPILGLGRVGLGSVAAFASLPSLGQPGWGAQWEPALFDPLLRWLGRGRPAERPRLVLEGSTLTLEGAPADWPALLVASSVNATQVRESQLAPPSLALLDPGSTRCGEWPWSEPRGAEVTIRAADGSQAELAVLSLPPATPEEFVRPGREVAMEASPAPEGPATASRARLGRIGSFWGLVFLGLGSALVAGAGLAWGRR